MINSRKVLIFDLDGTLVDSAPDLRHALNGLLAEIGRRPVSLAEVKMMVGDGAAKLVERAVSRTAESAGTPRQTGDMRALTERFLQLYEGAAAELTRPFPAVPETLRHLRAAGYRAGICTNKPLRATQEILTALALSDCFEAISGGDSEPVRKPDPAHLLAVLARMAAEASDAVMIGDSANDVAAARGAGVPVILVPHGYGGVPAQNLGADLVLARFADLPAALALPPFSG